MRHCLFIASGLPPAEALALRAGPTEAVRAALLAARRRTLALADDFQAALGTAYPGIPYAPELNPPLWELGHVAWFQEWWIARNRQRALGVACDPAHARGASLLPQADAWYDSSRVAHRTRWDLPLPHADATREYLNRTLSQTMELLNGLPPDADDGMLYFFRLVALHEEMHAEAATYMAQNLGIDLPDGEPAHEHAAPIELDLPAQRFRMGSDAAGFAFDNELQSHEVALEPLRIDAQAVTWARFLPFIESGGYDSPTWWSDAGRAWLAGQPLRHPVHLRLGGSGWQQRRGGRWLPLESAACSGSPQRARSRGLVPLGRPAPSHRGAMGVRGAHPAGLFLGPGLGMDGQPVRALSGLRTASLSRLLGAVVRQPARAARRLPGNVAGTGPCALPQFLRAAA